MSEMARRLLNRTPRAKSALRRIFGRGIADMLHAEVRRLAAEIDQLRRENLSELETVRAEREQLRRELVELETVRAEERDRHRREVATRSLEHDATRLQLHRLAATRDDENRGAG